ncbi:hypothetical protein CWD94_10060 [Lysinibacillus xylanilyticus]|uniref:Uncharacterized protein n=1 Tax=Lysinibacillus xylanilyticus TaxID=582475 RepID=A0A2M9Q792_9BACI|nr:hypothetical protein CWD94_10060 [Lysinibacillus xylanilyticus]
MEDGDYEANVAHYCLHKLKKWPSEFDNLPLYEKAFVIASVQLKIKADKDGEKEAKQGAKGKRAGRKKR